MPLGTGAWWRRWLQVPQSFCFGGKFSAVNFGKNILHLDKSLLHWLGHPTRVVLSPVVSYGWVFAYKAKNQTNLVAGIDKFLDQVMAPGEWNPPIWIEPLKNILLRWVLCWREVWGGQNSQGPSLTQSSTQSRSKTSQLLQIHISIFLPF